MSEPILRFIGGNKKLDGIPARDLTEEEIEQLERTYPEAEDIAQILVDTGVYAWAKKTTIGGQNASHRESKIMAN